MSKPNGVFKVVSIDAWYSEGDWEWNNWFTKDVSYCEKTYGVLNEENVLKFFQNEFLKDGFEDDFYIYDDQFNFVLCCKSNHEPIYAIEYGSVDYV